MSKRASANASQPPRPPADMKLTPAMQQYWDQRQQVPDAILLFRMGDFYELFYDDAELGARILGITLTSRDSGRTPLAGIPYHALESYLAKLVNAGYKVAISEQTQDAKDAKGVVERAIVRIVTPGTLTDDGLLDRSQANVVAALYPEKSAVGVAALELSTGQFSVLELAAREVADEIGRLAPAELLVPDDLAGTRPEWLEAVEAVCDAPLTWRLPADFTADRAQQVLQEHFETASLEGFGFTEVDASLQAAGALLAYARETQKAAVTHLLPPRRVEREAYMTLDPVTLRSLEVEKTLRTGARGGSLLAAVDRTRNPMGARLLRQWLCYPLRDVGAIRRRQELIELLRADAQTRLALRTGLRETADLERLIGRLGVGRASPRDVRALGEGLRRLRQLRGALEQLSLPQTSALAEDLSGLDDVADALCAAIAAEPPLTVREGNIFADGHHAELDRLRSIGRDGQQWLAEYQAQQSERTGIPSLKVKFNKVFGYYIEVTNTHRDRVPDDYTRKQTMKNAERFITEELKQYESEALSAESRSNELEYELFVALREQLEPQIPAMQRAAQALARLDVLAGWAELAAERKYCRPTFTEGPLLAVEGGRHPVLEQTLEAGFTANDTLLDAEAQSLALITGPNMAGKSTYIRQVALLALLAHCGCWVPARSMKLGLIDRIFTRVGASDELARGQSTFMVEMVETANILHNASKSSLVILDEIGRGTSTFDGVALAWAISEHLATNVGCRTLFATHYHELTELAEILEPVFNLNVSVREYEDQVVFLHKIVPGAAGRSYGLHVGKLAGLPRGVLERANAVLNELEKTFARESQRPVLAAVQRRRMRQLRLFEEPEEVIVRELRDLDSAALADAATLEKLRAWRKLLGMDETASAE